MIFVVIFCGWFLWQIFGLKYYSFRRGFFDWRFIVLVLLSRVAAVIACFSAGGRSVESGGRSIKPCIKLLAQACNLHSTCRICLAHMIDDSYLSKEQPISLVAKRKNELIKNMISKRIKSNVDPSARPFARSAICPSVPPPVRLVAQPTARPPADRPFVHPPWTTLFAWVRRILLWKKLFFVV